MLRCNEINELKVNYLGECTDLFHWSDQVILTSWSDQWYITSNHVIVHIRSYLFIQIERATSVTGIFSISWSTCITWKSKFRWCMTVKSQSQDHAVKICLLFSFQKIRCDILCFYTDSIWEMELMLCLEPSYLQLKGFDYKSGDLVTPDWSWAPQTPLDKESEPLKQGKQESKCKLKLMSHVKQYCNALLNIQLHINNYDNDDWVPCDT